MQLCKLGRTDLEVSRVALGGLFTSQLGGSYAESEATILSALDLGINYIDTAPAYSDSESVIGRALAKTGRRPIISTKLGSGAPGFDPRDKHMLRKSVEQSLAKLQRTSIDLLFIHEPDRPMQYQWWNDGPLENSPVLRLVGDLKREGLVRYVGLGGTTAYELARLVETNLFDVVLTAANYSLLWREAQIELLPATRKHNVGVIAGTPLQQGALAKRHDTEIWDGTAAWLSKPRRDQFVELYRFLDTIEIPVGELALRFMLSCPDIDCVLTGARSSAEIEENVRSIQKGPLPVHILRRIDEIAALVPFRPYEEPTVLPFGRRWKGPGMLR